MPVILNEKKHAEYILKNNEIGSKPSSTLFLLGKYYRKFCGYDAKETYKKLNEFMVANYNNYNSVLWENIIDDISKKSNKYSLREVDEVGLTQRELDLIALLNDINLEKIVFSMLCHAKLYNLSSANNDNWVNTKLPEIFKTARVNVKFKNDKMMMINKILNNNIMKNVDEDGVIINTPLISISKKNTNKNIRLLFVDNENEPVLKISDFRELGYEYLLYRGENYSRCAECDILFKQNKNNTYKYCIKHRGYQPLESKNIQCVDCGKVVGVDPKDNETCRCEECYKKYRKMKVKENVRRFREKNKSM